MGEEQKTRAKRMAIGATCLGVLALVPAFIAAGFTFWAIGEANWPPPFLESPLTWADNFFAVTLPVVIVAGIIGLWISYAKGAFSWVSRICWTMLARLICSAHQFLTIFLT